MNDLADMIWIEARKAIRSRMPLWTLLGSLFMPLGVAGLIVLAKDPEFSRSLGLISAKANLTAYYATDWSSYLSLFAEIVAAGGFFFFVMAMSWVFGREFTDGTVKDMLAVPVQRASILLAKFIVWAAWSAAIACIIIILGLVMGALIQLPGGSLSVILHGSMVAAITSCLTIVTILPFALFASVGRGYMLPMGAAVLLLITANMLMITGWAEYFPYAILLIYAQGESPLAPISYWIVLLTGLAGMIATYFWWKYADQNR
jgi:ABC-2 type transport system permease protein